MYNKPISYRLLVMGNTDINVLDTLIQVPNMYASSSHSEIKKIGGFI